MFLRDLKRNDASRVVSVKRTLVSGVHISAVTLIGRLRSFGKLRKLLINRCVYTFDLSRPVVGGVLRVEIDQGSRFLK